MEDLLIEILRKLNFPVVRQGSLGEKDGYPDKFFTFWNNSSNYKSHYDDDPINIVWDFDVNFYSSDPVAAYSEMARAIENLKKAGFIISGRGYDVPSDASTHIGRGINVLYLEKL